MNSSREIVVGIDGSASAHTAARWAAAEAGRRQLPVHLVHAYWEALSGPTPGEWTDPARTYATAVLAEAEHLLTTEFADVPVHSSLLHQHPIAALRELALDAEMIVVGAHGNSRISGALLGSIASRAISHLPGVVVVVGPDTAPTGNGSVLVGLDGSADSEWALGFAFHEAALRKVTVAGVRVWDDSSYRAAPWSAGMIASDAEIAQEEGALLSEQLRPWRLKFPDVIVTESVLHGKPSVAIQRNLISHGEVRPPSMVVVGSRGHSGLAGRLAGSVSNALISHASCPVAVVHPPQ